MAVKTDISKAYDRVEWNFLEQAMVQLGFNHIWIRWVMSCVRSVNYSVLINGSLYGNISPQRGIRQGDPLSPYLFLFCAEMLTQRLHHEESKKNIKGLSISNFGSRVSHLLFDDDSFFLCQANRRNSMALAKIFSYYGIASGQNINFDKSSIIFGSRVSEVKKEEVKRHIQINQTGGCGKYLGLPEEFTRKKREMFEYIVKKLKIVHRDGIINFYLKVVKKCYLKQLHWLCLPMQ